MFRGADGDAADNEPKRDADNRAPPVTGNRTRRAGYTEDTILCGSFKLRSEAESERDGEEF